MKCDLSDNATFLSHWPRSIFGVYSDMRLNIEPRGTPGCISSLLSGVPDYFGRNKISSGGDLSHYSSASLY